MQEVKQQTVNRRKKAALKALILAAFIIGAILLVRLTPVKDYLTVDSLGRFLNRAGFWAPVVFMLVYAAGVCLFLPGTMLGATVAFFIGRTLGREFAASLIGNRLKRYDDAIERNGFATVLYLRLVYFPFTPMNFGMGLTKVHFWDYFAGTGLGIIVGTFIFTFFIGTLKEIWASGNWAGLVSFKVFFSIGLFIFSFSIPRIIKKIRGEES
jgi:uncharacterized membrane protein YdjX (TVP38/TMEM64 family)